jgi:exodeoxyribonuclease-3
MKIISWNVNGIRAAEKKGFVEWVENSNADIICIQETKAHPEQLGEDLLNINGYKSYFESAEKKGYSGVAIYTKHEPLEIKNMGIKEFDNEGRFIAAKFSDFTLINAYFPNSQEKGKRLDYKLEFLDAMLKYANTLVNNGENVIICGDYNIAHEEIDLARPKQNTENPGFLPEERAWMTKFLNSGYIDTFRHFYPEEVKYSWWSYRARARENNVGWRIDYHCINQKFIDKVEEVDILTDVLGSDHCPVYIKLK